MVAIASVIFCFKLVMLRICIQYTKSSYFHMRVANLLGLVYHYPFHQTGFLKYTNAMLLDTLINTKYMQLI